MLGLCLGPATTLAVKLLDIDVLEISWLHIGHILGPRRDETSLDDELYERAGDDVLFAMDFEKGALDDKAGKLLCNTDGSLVLLR